MSTKVPTSASKPPKGVTTKAPAATTAQPIVTDVTQSYIASSVNEAYFVVDRALRQSVDDAEAKYGLDLYETIMMREPTMAGIDRALKILVLADGVRVTTAFPPPPRTGATAQQIGDYDRSQRMQEYFRACIDALDNTGDDSIFDISENLLDGCRIGHKLAEVTFNDSLGGQFVGRYGIESITCKPRENYAFVVDWKNKVQGVIARIPSVSILVWQGIIYDPSLLANAIAPEKLLVMTVGRTNSDPRGRSWWRGCWDPYHRKQLAKPNEVKTLVQYGGGMITVVAPEIKASVSVTDFDTGNQVSMMQAIDSATSRLMSGHHATYPFGTLVQVHRPEGNLAMFESSFTRYDEEMVRSFMLSSQSILEAKHSSKASSSSAMDLLDELKMYVRERLCARWNRLARTMVGMSFGPEWLPYAPLVKMQKASRPDFAANAAALGPLFTAIGPQTTDEQWDYFMTEVLGAPPGRVAIDLTAPQDPADQASQDEGDAAAMAARFHTRKIWAAGAAQRIAARRRAADTR